MYCIACHMFVAHAWEMGCTDSPWHLSGFRKIGINIHCLWYDWSGGCANFGTMATCNWKVRKNVPDIPHLNAISPNSPSFWTRVVAKDSCGLGETVGVKGARLRRVV